LCADVSVEWRRGEEVVVEGISEVRPANEDAVNGGVEAGTELALEADAGLLGLRIAVIGSSAEDNREWGQRATLTDVDAELGEVGGGNGTGRRRNSDDPLRPQRREDIGGALGSRCLNRGEDRRNGPEAVGRYAKGVDGIVDLKIDSRVVDAVAAAEDSFRVGAPGETEAGRELVVVGWQGRRRLSTS